jgi:hypothetical protein
MNSSRRHALRCGGAAAGRSPLHTRSTADVDFSRGQPVTMMRVERSCGLSGLCVAKEEDRELCYWQAATTSRPRLRIVSRALEPSETLAAALEKALPIEAGSLQAALASMMLTHSVGEPQRAASTTHMGLLG